MIKICYYMVDTVRQNFFVKIDKTDNYDRFNSFMLEEGWDLIDNFIRANSRCENAIDYNRTIKEFDECEAQNSVDNFPLETYWDLTIKLGELKDSSLITDVLTKNLNKAYKIYIRTAIRRFKKIIL